MSKEERAKKMVNDELMAIDWNDVDQFPLFEDCDENASKFEQKDCFEQSLMAYVVQAFEGFDLELNEAINDTIHVDLQIDQHGFITVLNIEENSGVQQQIPNFQDEVGQRLNDLTTVAPAIKRGIPVSVNLQLPLVLNTTD